MTALLQRTAAVCWLILMPLFLLAQDEIVIVGRTFDRKTQLPVANATVALANTSIAAQSNAAGYFLLRCNAKQIRLVVTAAGYRTYTTRLKHKNTGIDIRLSPLLPSELPLETVKEDAFALQLIQKAIAAKKKNNPKNDRQPFTVSEKWKAYACDIPPRWVTSDHFKQGTFMEADSLLSIPLYTSDKVLRQSNYPAKRADREALFDNEKSVLPIDREYARKLMGLLLPQQNFYRNRVVMLGHYFISPIATIAWRNYSFFLQDSVVISNRKCYTIGFRPKRKDAWLLTGSVTIDSLTNALVAIEASLPTTIALNFIRSMNVYQQFSLQQGNWYYDKIDGTLVLALPYSTGRFDKPLMGIIDKELKFSGGNLQEMDSVRKYERQPASDTLFHKLTVLNTTSFMRKVNWLADLYTTQYAHAGKIDIGPLNTFYQNNVIEGAYIGFGLRTGEQLWRNVTVGGNVGYGYEKNKWKFGGELKYRLPTESFQQLSIQFSRSGNRTGYNENIFLVNEQKISPSDDDVFASLLRFNPNRAINEMSTWTFRYQREWTREFRTTLTLFNNRIFANQYVDFVHNGQSIPSILHQGAKIDFRFSQDQLIWDRFFDRRLLSNYYPVFHILAEAGGYKMDNIAGDYYKLHATVKQAFGFWGGILYYNAEVGYIGGKVPFPLLEIERGNETYVFSDYNFNLMNYLEYLGDKYIHLHAHLYSSGWFFNQIPYVKALGLREVFSLNVAENGLRKENQQLLDFPQDMRPLNTPYVEAGAGIYNILRCLGVQSVWRITHRNDPRSNNWGWRVLFYLNF